MAKSPAATRTPVAGQPGFDPFAVKSEPVPIEQRKDEMGPAPVAKQERHLSPGGSKPAKEATADELLAYLLESGTNPQKMSDVRAWITVNPSATCEQCFRFMEAAEDHGRKPVAEGTLKKAGKWIWGAEWDIESAVLSAPIEEIGRLRGQIANLEGQLAAKNADLAGTKHQLAHLQDRVTDLTRQNGYLQVGKSKDELSAAGVNPGTNSLMAKDAL